MLKNKSERPLTRGSRWVRGDASAVAGVGTLACGMLSPKTIEQLVQDISEQFKLDRVTLVTNTSQYLHAANPPELFEAHKHKLNWTVQEAVDKKLLGCGQEIIVFSKTINNEIILRPSFVNNN